MCRIACVVRIELRNKKSIVSERETMLLLIYMCINLTHRQCCSPSLVSEFQVYKHDLALSLHIRMWSIQTRASWCVCFVAFFLWWLVWVILNTHSDIQSVLCSNSSHHCWWPTLLFLAYLNFQCLLSLTVMIVLQFIHLLLGFLYILHSFTCIMISYFLI